LSCGWLGSKKKDHDKCPKFDKKPKFETRQTVGQPPRAAVLVINQLRDRGIGSHFKMAPDAGGGRGLRHAKAYDIDLQAREVLSVRYGGRDIPYGQRVQVEVSKSKIGPPHRRAVLEMHFENVPGIASKGEYNSLVDLVGCKWGTGDGEKRIAGLGEMAGVLKISGAWYYLGDEKFHGLDSLARYLADNEAVLRIVQAQVADWIRRGAPLAGSG
jgi:hypothetical protein